MRKNLLLVTALLAIALVVALVFGTCGKEAVSQRNNYELTSAESWGKQCMDSFATISVELEAALKIQDRTEMRRKVEDIVSVREQLCNQASLAMKTAIDDHVYNESELIAASKRIDDYRSWALTIRNAIAQYEESPSDATLAYLRSLMH
ncbi:MAG TPA: hypothetical protein VLB44_05655 [Kofleriaceae bacterium]|nr:hypothetical protein [Kofleriaceae bacterium]